MKKKVKTYTISAVAELFDIHPQTLRLYEREGLLKPSRSIGNTRLYEDGDLERLEIIREFFEISAIARRRIYSTIRRFFEFRSFDPNFTSDRYKSLS